jgi:hypothetical protein
MIAIKRFETSTRMSIRYVCSVLFGRRIIAPILLCLVALGIVAGLTWNNNAPRLRRSSFSLSASQLEQAFYAYWIEHSGELPHDQEGPDRAIYQLSKYLGDPSPSFGVHARWNHESQQIEHSAYHYQNLRRPATNQVVLVAKEPLNDGSLPLVFFDGSLFCWLRAPAGSFSAPKSVLGSVINLGEGVSLKLPKLPQQSRDDP